MRSNQQHWIHWIIEGSSELNCLPHKRGFVFIAYKQCTSKTLIQIIHSHNLPAGHASLCLFMRYLCVRWRVCVSMHCCVMLYLSSCAGKNCQSAPGNWWDIKYGSNAGHSLGKSEASWSQAAMSLNPTIPLLSSRSSPESVNPVITQYIRAKPGSNMLQSKGPLNLRGNCSLPWACLPFSPGRFNVIRLQVWASLSAPHSELPVHLLWRHRSAPMMSWLSCSFNGRCLSVSLSLTDGDQLLSRHVRNYKSPRFYPPAKQMGQYNWKRPLRTESLTFTGDWHSM